MDSSPTQNDSLPPGGEKRRRTGTVDARQPISRQEALRASKRPQDQERVDPEPVAILGPVPTIAEQTARLMQDPSFLVQEMKRRSQDDETPDLETMQLHELDFDDDEPDITTGYEVHQMQPIEVRDEVREEDPSPAEQKGEAREPVAERSPQGEGESPPEAVQSG